MESQPVGSVTPNKTAGFSLKRVLKVLFGIALVLSLTCLGEELQLASLSGRWSEVHREQGGPSPSGLSWRVTSGAGSGGDFRRLIVSRGSRDLLTWSGNADEIFGSLRLYRDVSSREPRFLCYQPLTTGPQTGLAEVDYGITLVEGAIVRPIVTNTISQLLRNPSALLGWGEPEFPPYKTDAGLLDHP